MRRGSTTVLDAAHEVLRYEARSTTIFGNYSVWRVDQDGTHTRISHGSPQACEQRARKLNEELAAKRGLDPRCRATRVLEDADPADWHRHRFGLAEARWGALRGRGFWITGAGSGYGRCLAVALAAAGARVALTGRRAEKLADSLDEMRRLSVDPRACLALAADVRDPDALADAAERIARESGALHGLVNGAALPQRAGSATPLRDMPSADWHALFATNVTAAWYASRAALPAMLRAGAVRIVMLSSEAGWAATPGFGVYNATKAALNSLGASLGAELAAAHPRADVQVNVLVPGEARTEMNQGSSLSPYRAVSMALALLSHPRGGPNGRFFHRDGRHLEFAHTLAWERDLLAERAE